MKRLIAALAIFALGFGPAAAEQIDEYRDALDAFLGGYSAPGDFLLSYADRVLTEIDGTWVEISLLDGRTDPSAPTPMSQSEFERMCGIAMAQSVMARTGPLSFTMTRFGGSDAPLVYSYQALGGAQFTYSAPPDQVMKRFGLDIEKVFEGKPAPWYTILRNTAGPVEIFAPSPNVRVFLAGQGGGSIFARCGEAK